MRVILDTNILVSSLIVAESPPHELYEGWRAGLFELVTCEEQFREFRDATRHEKLRPYISAAHAGALMNELRRLAVRIRKLPRVEISRDPGDDYLLALAQAAHADYLVTGDKAGLLALGRHGKTRIVTARRLAGIIRG